ncbi:MAG: hypothetical protein IJH57_01705 [Mogibacterium sp.]|nr:hypothetical protein [Mogibacterium sp.]
MKAERIQTLTGILAIVCGVLALSAGRWIMGGIIIMLAFGMFWNRGFGNINERSIYENEIESDLTIPQIYEKLKDMDTPLGKAWIGEHKGYPGESIIFGPSTFKDVVVISQKGKKLNIKHITLLDNIGRDSSEEHRFKNLISTDDANVTYENYSKFAGFKLASVMMIRHLREMLEEMNGNSNAEVPKSLDAYNLYYHNSNEGWFKDAEGNKVLRVENTYHPFAAALYNADDEQMASVHARKLNARGEPVHSEGFDLYANGEPYAEILPMQEKRKEGFVVKTEDGEFKLTLFPACRRANIACNYMITKDDEIKAVIGGSSKIVFQDGDISQNDEILSYDDDYLVLYAMLEIFIISVHGRFLK